MNTKKAKNLYSISITIVFIMLCFNRLKAWEFPEIKGWTLISEVKSFTPENLWQPINGAAELFLNYGFQVLNTAEFSSQDVKINVQIYDLGSLINAFGVYIIERGDTKEKLNIGTEAVIHLPYQCLLLKNSFYIKVDIFEGTITAIKAKELLMAMAAALPGENGLPEELKLLPVKNKIIGSEGFIKDGYMGISDLKNCIFASYVDNDGNPYTVFYLLLKKGDSAESEWSKFQKTWKPVAHKKHAVLAKKIPYYGLTGIIFTKHGIFGVSGLENESGLLEKLTDIIQRM
ncbi:MAG: hypothetical protein A2161_00350 [Candidatus Schekmanbacteria bacterium RBG_13_48_7]|uniref:Uncharacterized protein n=1 Tax=Candidatus Schekmanbacteria bacterium RBG_13_48_7 TaxID=1817878 RepID=A0A1F7S7H6_9BACT|nr:MAG: hypothetical protein A2161_00350 [Candidatus Schekmanbacteria bacterium RBG_13_48_7]